MRYCCQCKQCKQSHSGQRTFDVLSIPDPLELSDFSVSSKRLWQNMIISCYNYNLWLVAFCVLIYSLMKIVAHYLAPKIIYRELKPPLQQNEMLWPLSVRIYKGGGWDFIPLIYYNLMDMNSPNYMYNGHVHVQVPIILTNCLKIYKHF